MRYSSAPLSSPLDYLPEPDAVALAHSRRVSAHVHDRIAAAGGTIDFASFMEQVLYAPGLGYYSAGARKLGADGDFITAPEISPLFGHCLARQCREILTTLDGGDILELGAGSGALACDLLAELDRLQQLPRRYLILEVSADLRERQQRLIAERIPALKDRVCWLEQLPQEPISGIVLGNEVVDALPVHCLVFDNDRIQALHVASSDDGFEWRRAEGSEELQSVFGDIRERLSMPLPQPYHTEVNLRVDAWLASLAATLERGVMLLIDYGYPRDEYYHPQRDGGTLICHYRHRAHTDPFLYPGLQDISASVDFTGLAEAGHAAGLEIAGFTTQAHFLIGCGLDSVMTAFAGDHDYLTLSSQAKRLTLPSEMGERFKVMALTRGYEAPLAAMHANDQRHRL